MKKIRMAIVGTGKASHMHARVLKKLDEAELVAVSSRNIEKAKQFASVYGINYSTDVGEMIKTNYVDAVIVCTPHPNHSSPAVDAMQAGAHVLVEKPLASNLEDCDKMISASKMYNKKLGVISQRRFFPASMRCKKAIEDGKLGIPMIGTVTMLGWRDEAYYKSDPWRGSWQHEGGGVLVNQAPHQLDLLMWYMGSEPESLFGTWKNINHPYVEIEDTAIAILNFKNGAVANILVSNSQKPGLYGNVHIHGSTGASVGVQTESGAMFIAGVSSMKAPPSNDMWGIPGEEDFLDKFSKEDREIFSAIDPIDYSIGAQQLNFIESITHDREPMVNAIEGRKVVEVFTAIYQSQRSGELVKWPLFNRQ
jgi:predicted dehydrogenase